MRALTTLLVFSFLILSGCESLSDDMRERFSTVPPQTERFDGDIRTVYAAAKRAFKRLDFVLTDTSASPIRMEASSRILRSEALGDSRQLVVNISLHDGGAGKTEVSVLVTQQVANASLGGPSSQVKREHIFYETFFAALEQALQERADENN